MFRTDPSIYDGRFANNGWLQELPKPLTKITWDNVAHVSPKTAQELLGTQENSPGSKGREHYVQQIEIKYRDRTLSGVPVWIMPGHPDNVITIHLGYGRTRAGRVGTQTDGTPVGFNAYSLRTSDAPWFGTDAAVQKVSGQYLLATTQTHFNMEEYKFSKEDRDILRVKTLEEYLHPKAGEHESKNDPPEHEALYDPRLYDYEPGQWFGLCLAWLSI